MRDLSWEDKELVLRVLFSKMNKAQNQADKTSMRALNVPGSQQRGGTMPRPVFISEGAFFPSQESQQAQDYQANFEVGAENDDVSQMADNQSARSEGRSEHDHHSVQPSQFTLDPDLMYKKHLGNVDFSGIKLESVMQFGLDQGSSNASAVSKHLGVASVEERASTHGTLSSADSSSYAR